jgi:hypothetical protein
MAIQQRVEPTAARRADEGRRRTVLVTAALGVVALLLWPLETLILGILAGTVFVLLEGLNALAVLHPHAIAPKRVLEHSPAITAAVVGIGAIAVALWRVPMALAALMLALLACAMNAYARWAAHRALRVRTPEQPMEPLPAVEPTPTVEPTVAEAVSPPEPRRATRARATRSKRPAPTRRSAPTRTSKRAPAKRAPASRRRTRQAT